MGRLVSFAISMSTYQLPPNRGSVVVHNAAMDHSTIEEGVADYSAADYMAGDYSGPDTSPEEGLSASPEDLGLGQLARPAGSHYPI
jgi:hypothetical protein